MKSRYFLKSILFLLLSLSLSSCLIFEKVRLLIDLTKMNGQIEYLNLVSVAEKKDSYWTNELEKEEFLEELKQERQDDLKRLIRDYTVPTSSSNKEVISNKLVRRKKQLNGIEKFKLKSLDEFEIMITPDSSKYVMKLDEDNQYLSGNGFLLKTDTANYIAWDIDTKKIDIKIKVYDLADFDYVESMLSYWQEWKKSN